MTDVPRSIEQLKKDAKRLKHNLGISHAEALNRIATDYGLPSWEALLAQRNLSANRIPLLSLPVAAPNSPDRRFMSERIFMLPVFLPIAGSAGTGKTVVMLDLARQLLSLGQNVCYISPKDYSFSQKPWPKDIGAKLARSLLQTGARFTAFDRETLDKLGNHYLAVFERITPNSIVLLDDMFSLPVGSAQISEDNPIDLSPLFARGCRVVVGLQTLHDLTCLRFGKDQKSTSEITQDSDVALLSHTRDRSADLAILDGFGFGSGVRDCLDTTVIHAADRPASFGFWLVQNTRVDVTFVTLAPQDTAMPA